MSVCILYMYSVHAINSYRVSTSCCTNTSLLCACVCVRVCHSPEGEGEGEEVVSGTTQENRECGKVHCIHVCYILSICIMYMYVYNANVQVKSIIIVQCTCP